MLYQDIYNCICQNDEASIGGEMCTAWLLTVRVVGWQMTPGLWSVGSVRSQWVNTLRPRQNGRHFVDDTFKCIFMNENVKISIKNSLKFVPKGPFNNNSALVQIMAWRRLGHKPLSETMMVRSPTHICVTRPQWVNNVNLTLNYSNSSLVQNQIW